MISSSEFIKGYTKIIICSYLFKKPDYVYNIVKNIQTDGEGFIKLSNPSALVVMKEMEKDKLVRSYIKVSEQNQARKYYELTKEGEAFYLEGKKDYLRSLSLLKEMIGGAEHEI